MKMYLHQWNLQSSLNRCEQCIYSLEKKKRLMSIKYYVEVKKFKAFPLYFFNKKFMFMHTHKTSNCVGIQIFLNYRIAAHLSLQLVRIMQFRLKI